MKQRGQITIFVIIGLGIIFAIILYFVLSGKFDIKPTTLTFPNTNEDIRKCVEDTLKDSVEVMLPQGGYVNPSLYKLYQDSKVAFLCYSVNYYARCQMQEPNYISRLASEIKLYSQNKIEDCFYAAKKNYEGKSFKVILNKSGMEIKFNSKEIIVKINKEMQLEKSGKKENFNNFEYKVSSPIFNLGNTALEIANQEARFCDFNPAVHDAIYTDMDITKVERGDARIYLIEDRLTGKVLKIAIRSCALIPGI